MFRRYVQLDLPCRIDLAPAAADPLSRPRLRVDTVQDDQVVASVLVAAAPLEGGRDTG